MGVGVGEEDPVSCGSRASGASRSKYRRRATVSRAWVPAQGVRARSSSSSSRTKVKRGRRSSERTRPGRSIVLGQQRAARRAPSRCDCFHPNARCGESRAPAFRFDAVLSAQESGHPDSRSTSRFRNILTEAHTRSHVCSPVQARCLLSRAQSFATQEARSLAPWLSVP